MKPSISIIIPTFNRVDLLSETLQSVVAQTYEGWECVVVDDGSTDQTEELLESLIANDSRFSYFKRPDSMLKGPNSCRNFGFLQSKGQFIKWLDSDDLLVTDALQKIVDAFTSDTDAVISPLQFIDADKNILERTHGFYSDDVIADYLTGKIAYYTPGPTWNREFLEKQTLLFDESIRNLDDWDFNLRMLYASPKIAYISQPLIKYRIHATSLSREIGKLNLGEIESEFNARRKHLKLLRSNEKADPKLLEDFIVSRHMYLLRQALLQKSPIRFQLFAKCLNVQFEFGRWKAIGRTSLAYTLFSLSGKGYKLLAP